MDIDLGEPTLLGARFTESHVVALLADGREIATPLVWYPSLIKASVGERQLFEVSPFGLHWPDLDEDLSVRGMLTGQHAANSDR